MQDELETIRAEREVTLHPVERGGVSASGVRMVGPGRLERGYLVRIGALEERAARADRQLELAALVERGSTRLLDRVEAELARARAQENRLLVVLGALQRDNEVLAERTRALEARLAVLGPSERAPGFLARLLARARRLS